MLRMAGSSYKPCVAIAAMLTAADNKLGQFTTADGSRRYGLVTRGIGRPNLRTHMYSWQRVMPSTLRQKLEYQQASGELCPMGFSLGHLLINSRRLTGRGTTCRLMRTLSTVSLITSSTNSRAPLEITRPSDFGIRYDITSVSFHCMGTQ